MSTILVIDDDEYMRDLLRLDLSNAGYQVPLAEVAGAAGHSLLRQRPDPPLLDVEMPIFMNGLEFVTALKAVARCRTSGGLCQFARWLRGSEPKK